VHDRARGSGVGDRIASRPIAVPPAGGRIAGVTTLSLVAASGMSAIAEPASG
jgi:hypothetical protein